MTNLLTGAALSALIIYTAYAWLTTPTVAYSYSTGQCVAVMGAPDNDCDNLPERFASVWYK